MSKVVNVLRFIRRIRVPIIIAVSTILILLGAYLATKGLVYGAVLDDNTIEYGDKPSFSANALFSKVSYEYRQEGSDVWTSEIPTRMGSYYVRAVSSGSFGTRYGKEQAFTIGARHIDVLIKEGSVVYGESPSVTADLAFGDTIFCDGYTFENTTLAKTNVIALLDKVVIKDASGKDVTSCYVLKAKAKEITFDKRDITLTIGSADKVYDGEPLRCEDIWQVTSGNLVYGDTVVKIDNSFSVIVGAGSVDNKGQFKVIRAVNGDTVVDVTHQYSINQIAGKLTVAQKPITIYPQGGEYVYDGKPHFEKSFTIDASTPLASGDIAEVFEAPAITSVGEIENLLILKITNQESDVTNNYCFTYAGELMLKVTKRNVTVETPSVELVYDGKNHTAEDGKVSQTTSLGEGHSLATIEATEIKNVESLENVLKVIVKDRNGSDVTDNYNLTYVYGTLTVVQREIVLTSGTLNGTYNGEEQYLHSVSNGGGQLAEGHTVKAKFTSTVKNCGVVVDNEFTFEIWDQNNQDVTSNYNWKKVYGTLSLERLPVSVTTDSISLVYDGAEHTHTSFKYDTRAQFVKGQTLKYTDVASIKNHGSVDNVFKVQLFEGEEDVTYNYDITYKSYGTIEITKRVITVTASSATKLYYDGVAMENPGYVIGGDGIAPNQTEEIEVLAQDYVNAGTWTNEVISVEIYDALGEKATDNYEISTYDGHLEIGRRPICLMSAQFEETKYYDGEKHTLHKVLVVENLETGLQTVTLPLVEGHVFDITFLEDSYVEYATQPKMNYFIVNDIYIDETDEIVTGNYAISQIFGELRLEKRPITFVSGSIEENTVPYDGYEHTVHQFTVSEENGIGLAKDQVANASFMGTITNAGEVDNTFEVYEILDKYGIDVTDEYVRTHEYGKLRVYPRPITLASQSASKVYNSIPLKNNNVTVGGMGWADGQFGQFKSFAELTDVGEIQNTFELNYIYSTKTHSEIDKENYDITFDFGAELEITKRPLTITVKSASKVYDGEYLQNRGYDVEICYGYEFFHTGLVVVHSIDMTLSGEIKYVGEKTVEYTKPKIFARDDSEVTNNYEITVIDGTLKVTPRDVTVSIPDFTKEYDGYELLPSVTNENVGGGGVVKEDYISAILSGSQTNVGSSTSSLVEYRFFDGETDITYCYNVTDTYDGGLEVTPRLIIVSVLGGYKEYYDGGEVVSQGYEVDRLLTDLGHVLSVDIIGSQINVGTSIAYADEFSLVITDGAGEDITYNYLVTEYISGELTVEKKRPITFMSASDKFLYNGKEQTNESYVIIFDENSMGLADLREEIECVVFDNEEMIDAGLYLNNFTVTISVLQTGEDTTDNYDINYIYGTIEIEKIKLTITTDSDSKIFDGTPLKNSGITVEYESLPEGYVMDARASGSIINVGTARNAYTLVVYNENGVEVSNSNFEITENLGQLTVTVLYLNITTMGAEKTYDGTALTNGEYTTDWETTEAFKRGELTLNVLVTGTRSDIGRSKNTALAFVYDKNGENVTEGNCEITIEQGSLTVYARPVVFVSDSGDFVYNGFEKSMKIAKLKDDGIGYVSKNHTVVYYFSGKFINAGAGDNEFTVDIVDSKTGESVLEFYPEISYEFGKIVIEKYKITIVAPSVKVQYVPGVNVYAPQEIVLPNIYLDNLNSAFLENIYTYSVDDMSDFYANLPGQVYTYAIPVERFHIYLNGEALDMSNFEVTSLEGTIKLSEQLLEINLYKIVKAYSGKLVSYKENDWYLREGQLPAGYTLDLKLEGGITEVGSIDLEILLEQLLEKGNIHVYDGLGNDVTEKFDFVFVGTPLTVTQKKIQITAGSSEKVYDGTALTDNTYSITSGGLARGHKIESVKIYGSITDVGTTNNTIGTVKIIDANGKDVTDNYDIERIDGALKVIEDEQNAN